MDNIPTPAAYKLCFERFKFQTLNAIILKRIFVDSVNSMRSVKKLNYKEKNPNAEK